MTRTQGPIESLGDAPDARPTIISTIHRNVVAECCGYLKPTGDRAQQGCRADNAQHLAACWNAIEAIGGDPAKVGRLVDICSQVLTLLEVNHKAWGIKTDSPALVRLRAITAFPQKVQA